MAFILFELFELFALFEPFELRKILIRSSTPNGLTYSALPHRFKALERRQLADQNTSKTNMECVV